MEAMSIYKDVSILILLFIVGFYLLSFRFYIFIIPDNGQFRMLPGKCKVCVDLTLVDVGPIFVHTQETADRSEAENKTDSEDGLSDVESLPDLIVVTQNSI
jgi:hypothetical protein